MVRYLPQTPKNTLKALYTPVLKVKGKSFDTEFMARVALDAIREEKTLAELPSQYEVHKTQIAKWRKRAVEGLGGIFQGKEAKSIGEKEKVIDELYRQIGQLKVESATSQFVWHKVFTQPNLPGGPTGNTADTETPQSLDASAVQRPSQHKFLPKKP